MVSTAEKYASEIEIFTLSRGFRTQISRSCAQKRHFQQSIRGQSGRTDFFNTIDPKLTVTKVINRPRLCENALNTVGSFLHGTGRSQRYPAAACREGRGGKGQPSTALEPSVTYHLQRPKRPATDSSTILPWRRNSPQKACAIPGAGPDEKLRRRNQCP